MAHELDFTTGRAAIAFRGSRDDIWHRHGQQFKDGWTMADWRREAGLAWECRKVPAYAVIPDDVASLAAQPVTNKAGGEFKLSVADGHCFLIRSDTGGILGHATDRYQPVQPVDLLDWFEQYIGVDDRFQLDVAGALRGGAIIWATATFNGGMDVAGDKHVARLLMTTTYDSTGATINRGTMTRVVCNNTLNAAMSDPRKSTIRTRHSARFDRAAVGRQLADIISQFSEYKAMAEAMTRVHVSAADTAKLFRHLLDIPQDAVAKDVSTRKRNAWDMLNACLDVTVRERGASEADRMWTVVNAVTRFVDHNKGSARGEADTRERSERRFLSANFGGTGEAMKRDAVAWLAELAGADLASRLAPAA